MSGFLAMGGYAGFVWPSYALAAGVLVWLLVSSLRMMRANEAALAAAEAARGPRRRRREAADGDDA
jgi:heme exporter protein D